MNRILVTGGSGFIGTNLVAKLLADGFTVLNLDKAKPINSQYTDYWTQVDILDDQALEAPILAFDPEAIVHLAAVTDLDGKTLAYYNTNTDGTQNVINVAKKVPALKRVLFTSSMYVCQPGYTPKNYDDYKPHTLYGESKVNGELLVKASKNTNFSWSIIRPTSIWGPWFNIPYIDFFNIVYQGKYFDFGRTCTKTYGYVDNTVFQIQKLLTADDAHTRTFYLGDNPAIQISEWANEISIEMGKGAIKKIPFLVMRTAALAGDVLAKVGIRFPITSFRLRNMTTNNILPLDDIYEITGPVPATRLQGVRKTLNWLADHKGYILKGLKKTSIPERETQPNLQ